MEKKKNVYRLNINKFEYQLVGVGINLYSFFQTCYFYLNRAITSQDKWKMLSHIPVSFVVGIVWNY